MTPFLRQGVAGGQVPYTRNRVDEPRASGRPTGFDITVRDVQINTGAGFLVVLTGEMMRMPGLPRKPAAIGIDLVDGVITGLT